MQIRNCGEQSVILSVSYDRTTEAVSAVRRLYGYIQNHPHPAIESVRLGLDCIYIEYSSDEIQEWLVQLNSAVDKPGEMPHREIALEVPVCYDLGEDLPGISATTGLKLEEIIRIHSSPTYQVWMIGFMPGFPYLGELPRELQIHRKDTPSTVVPAGSVAIAEEYVGIYPIQSPGGWHIIGRTPLQILNYNRKIPWTFDYGMDVKFVPITVSEYERINNEAARN